MSDATEVRSNERQVSFQNSRVVESIKRQRLGGARGWAASSGERERGAVCACASRRSQELSGATP
jgi:hypothetical protein